MKTILLNLFLFFSVYTYSQQKVYTKNPNSNEEWTQLNNDKKDFGVINEKVSFGLSLGYNTSFEELKIAEISPIDNKLVISNGQRTSFVLSSVVSVPILFSKKKYFRFTDKDGKQIGQLHTICSWSLIAVVNLVTLQGAQSGNVFNQKLSGGLGVAYNFNEDFSIGLSYELNSYRKPKDYLIELEGNEIIENGEQLKSLDISNNNYFYDYYASIISLKFIYKLTTK